VPTLDNKTWTSVTLCVAAALAAGACQPGQSNAPSPQMRNIRSGHTPAEVIERASAFLGASGFELAASTPGRTLTAKRQRPIGAQGADVQCKLSDEGTAAAATGQATFTIHVNATPAAGAKSASGSDVFITSDVVTSYAIEGAEASRASSVTDCTSSYSVERELTQRIR